jgi:hypothetical protein
MKEIATSQYHTIAGGFAEQCGRGPSSPSGNCSSGGSKGPNGGRDIQKELYKTSNEGSGSGAYNFGSSGGVINNGGGYRREVGSNR